MSTAPGWYSDDPATGSLRFWDGVRWTNYVAGRVAPPRPPHPRLPISAAVGALLATAAPIVGSRFLLRSLTGFHWPIAVYVAILAVVGYGPALAWCWYVARRWGRWGFRPTIGALPRWSDLGWGPITWLSCLATQIVVGVIVTVVGIPFAGNLEGTNELGSDRGYVIAVLIVAVVCAPLIEEIVFRGVVLRGLLSRMGPVAAVGLQGAIFGVAHVDPERGMGNIGLALMLGSVGVILGGAAYLFRRIGPGILAHAILNGLALTLALTGWLVDE